MSPFSLFLNYRPNRFIKIGAYHQGCRSKAKERRYSTLSLLKKFDFMLFGLQIRIPTEQRHLPLQQQHHPVGCTLLSRKYPYDVQVPYTYYICHVELENFNLSHVPVYIMSQDQLSMYAVYMSTLGNRPDLFAGSAYVGKYYNTDYEKYEIPPEALADEQFAAIIEEAEKYLGFPYVWGGSSPATSFDCSGFVSYVYNHCGLHWNFGRLGAEGLRSMSAYVSPESARPGDLIFFEKTYDTSGASHVGIYVGNNMMLHCGDPIQYTSIDTSYWRSHFRELTDSTIGKLKNITDEQFAELSLIPDFGEDE